MDNLTSVVLITKNANLEMHFKKKKREKKKKLTKSPIKAEII